MRRTAALAAAALIASLGLSAACSTTRKAPDPGTAGHGAAAHHQAARSGALPANAAAEPSGCTAWTPRLATDLDHFRSALTDGEGHPPQTPGTTAVDSAAQAYRADLERLADESGRADLAGAARTLEDGITARQQAFHAHHAGDNKALLAAAGDFAEVCVPVGPQG
ncbi:hypothetical protein [Peterkaempfera griseoplana]|uniref:hypothetical protein n=1 Tax=Peterkaempfera griseoplana TaxID=66896 RepID=UPI0006E42B45|nr:hypothetical protein [Peterkaempfera griseoplana]